MGNPKIKIFKKMKKIILLLAMVFSFGLANAKFEKINKHNGEVVEGKVIHLYE